MENIQYIETMNYVVEQQSFYCLSYTQIFLN